MGRIVVTGGTGLLGSNVVAQLLLDGCPQVGVVVRSEKSKEKLFASLLRRGLSDCENRLAFIEADLEDYASTLGALKNISVLYHCAGVVSFDGADGGNVVGANNEMAANVVDAALENGVELLVHVSSIAALGAVPEGLVTENSEIGSLSGQSAYAKGKLLAENQVWRGVALGLKAIVVCPSVILGAGHWQGSSAIFRTIRKGMPFYPGGATGYVDVEDVARAMVLLAKTPQAAGEKFILSAANLSYREFISKVAQAFGRRTPRIRAGRAMLATASFFSGLGSRLSGRPRAITPSLADTLCCANRYAGGKIVRYADFSYTDLDRTIHRIASEYESDHR